MPPTSKKTKSGDLPPFTPGTRVYEKDKATAETYKVQSYQYGTTSHDYSTMQPDAIIYPQNVADIQTAITYAKDNDLGIAVRTGGHQYSGFCSTANKNIQLDLSDTFQSDTTDFHYDDSQNLLYVGVSWSLLQLSRKFRDNNMFLPTGQCVHVHLGGHIQTGGYGQCARSFGLLSDYCAGFEIVLADGTHVAVMRPGSTYTIPSTHTQIKDDKLYWAVLGGSPGNYGILTHVWLEPLLDKDYPDSRGMKLITCYNKDKCEKILQVLAEMNDDPDMARDFDVCATVITNAVDSFFYNEVLHPVQDFKKWISGESQFRNFDQEMQYKYPQDFADGVDYGEDGKMAMPVKPVPMILIYFQWANVNGSSETFGATQKAYFTKMREAAAPLLIDEAFEKLEDTKLGAFLKMLKDAILDPRVDNWMYVNEDEHTPMSQLTRYWVYEDVREYLMSYEKRVYSSDKTDLSTNTNSSTSKELWAKWHTGRLDEVIKLNDPDAAVISQVQMFGGKNSMIYQNGDDGYDGSNEKYHGCHSWRRELTMGATMDYWYQPLNTSDASKDDNLKKAVAWQKVNDTSIGAKGRMFSDYDRRVMWGTFQTENDDDYGTNLGTIWQKYFDSQKKYDDLVTVKQRIDNDYTFSANTFSVGICQAPTNRSINAVKPRWATTS